MAIWKRKISLIAGVALGALALALLGDVLGLGQTVTVAIAAAALALVIVVGGPWAFGEGRFALQHWDSVHTDKAAVIANYEQRREGFARGHLVYFETMENYLFVKARPAVFPAGPALASGPLIEGEPEFVEVGNGVGHESDEQSTA
jgi:hypothetical protein